MDDILIYLLGGGIPLVIAYMLSKPIAKVLNAIFFPGYSKTSSKSAAPTRSVKVEVSCPHCGHRITQGYIPEKEPCPDFFVCSDCKRPFSTSMQITEEQKRRIEEANEDCRRVEMLPNLREIQYAVWRCVNDTWDGRVEFELGGNIYHYYSERIKLTSGRYSTQRTERLLNVSCSGITTYAGLKHLATICLDDCRKTTSGVLSTEYTLLDRGFSWEWKGPGKL